MSGVTGKGGWQGIVDPLGILLKAPPKKQAPPLTDQAEMPIEPTPQDTDRIAFLKAFGVQG